MQSIRRINQLILAKVLEIIFVLIFLIVISVFWQKKDNSVLLSALNKENLLYTELIINNPVHYNMFPMSEKDALSRLQPTILLVKNESLTFEKYILTLNISKKSTMDYNCLDIAINEEVKSVNSLEFMEDDSYFYFVIAKDILKAANKEYIIKIWLNENTGNEMQNKELKASFELVNTTKYNSFFL